MIRKVVILAAGLGTRLLSATKTDIQLIQQYLGKRLEPLTKSMGYFLLDKEQQASFS